MAFTEYDRARRKTGKEQGNPVGYCENCDHHTREGESVMEARNRRKERKVTVIGAMMKRNIVRR